MLPSDAPGQPRHGMRLRAVTWISICNAWIVQEVTRRLPGRIDPATTIFVSANDLASAMRRAAAAHGEHENHNGQRDANWPDWYATYMAAEQAGRELPK
jgi:hypothetical protein